MTDAEQEYEAAEAAYRAALAEVRATRRRLREAEQQLPIYHHATRIFTEIVRSRIGYVPGDVR